MIFYFFMVYRVAEWIGVVTMNSVFASQRGFSILGRSYRQYGARNDITLTDWADKQPSNCR